MSSRLFAGAFLPDEWRDRLVLMGAAIRESEPAWGDAKWVPQENLHVTLAFFGDVEEREVPVLCERLAAAAAGHAAFSLTFDAVRARPSLRRSRMLWARFDDPEGQCASLAADVAAAGGVSGSRADRRPFDAHVTLCRSRRPQPIGEEALDGVCGSVRDAPSSLSVPSFTLCESRLTPRGAVYSALTSWSLRGR